MADVGNLVFNNLNLIYDLETTDKIQMIGPFIHKPVVSRSVITRKDDLVVAHVPRHELRVSQGLSGGAGYVGSSDSKHYKYYGRVYPEITEITIKDYETGMILMDTLVKPVKEISLEVQKLTGITTSMIADKPNIDKIRFVLKNKMKNFNNCKMMSHNGVMFDDKIILYDKLVDPKKISFIDTLSLIPIHISTGIKLKSKKLGKIYYQLFHRNFKAHRAMADVDALIEIMRYLKIEF